MSEGQAPGVVETVDREEYQRLRAENERLRAALAAARDELGQTPISGNLLHEFLEATPHFVYAKDLQGRYILANAAYLSLFGLGIEELIGKQDRERFPPEIAAALRANDQAVVAAGHPLQFEEWLTLNGRDVYYLSTKFPLHDPHGAVYAVCAISTDITERQQVEEALRESEARFRLAIDAAPALVYASDLENDEILSIYGLEKLLGRAASEVRSRQWWMEQVHPDDLPAALAEVQAATAAGRNFELEYRVRHAKGHYLDVRENTTVLQDKEGHPLRHVGVVIDISPSKEAERELKALTLAEQRERRRLSAILHDDLQQLLFSLEIRLHLLQKETEGAPSPVADTLLRSLGEIESIMEQALAVTRTISLELNPPVLRSEGLEASLAWLGTHMEERHRLQVDLEMPDSLRVASEDERILLVQFVRELLFNVSEHAGSNRARVRVNREGDMLVLVVADEGIGFEVAEIMDPDHWQQGEGAVGLLSIRERLRLFGGRLLVESEPGQGTQITILMPLKQG